MSADGAVFIALMLAAVAVIACGWFLARGRGHTGFDPPRVLAPGDELLPPAPRPARGRRSRPESEGTEVAEEGAARSHRRRPRKQNSPRKKDPDASS